MNENPRWLKYVLILIALVIVAGGLMYVLRLGDPAATSAEADDPGAVKTQDSSSDLIGVWRSTQDPKYTREFEASGAVIDRYEGDESATATGTWSVFTAADAPDGLPFEIRGSDRYVLITSDGEALHFRIADASENQLELVYMDRGGVLTFVRVR